MRQKQDQDKRDLVESQRSMSSIEAAAKRQYAKDLKDAQEVQKQRLGEWVSVHAAYIFSTVPLEFTLMLYGSIASGNGKQHWLFQPMHPLW